MKKVLVLVVAVLAISAAAYASGKQVIVNNGSGGNVIPWWPSYFPSGCRVQMLYDKAAINTSGRINEFELQKTSTASGTFPNTKFYLCHTTVTALTTSFAGNYTGNTPVLVGSFSSYTVPASSGYYPIPMSTTFNYNNANSLILEITWEPTASGSNCALMNGSKTAYRCWARSPTASTGSVDSVGYNARISFDYYTTVAPTSLGRIKSLYN
jgi:opacity protein-like surface antigen